MTIDEIEALTESDAKKMAEEIVRIKDHTVYLVDLGEYFGYSALVFRDGRHIYFANDYALHYPHFKKREELRRFYEKEMDRKLFTDGELTLPSQDYGESAAKEYFLRNYYPMRREHQSIFAQKRLPWFDETKPYGTAVYSGICFCYFKPEDKEFAEHIEMLFAKMSEANNPLRDYEHAKSAFLYEMYNHEYPINAQGDYDVISYFASKRIEYKGDGSELAQTDWPDEIKRAYIDAAHECRRRFEG